MKRGEAEAGDDGRDPASVPPGPAEVPPFEGEALLRLADRFQVRAEAVRREVAKVIVDYPTLDEEIGIVERTTGPRQASVSPVLSRNEILGLQRVVRMLRLSSHIVEYATRLARRSRPQEPQAPKWVSEHIAWGAGPRAAQALLLAAKARTLLQGRFAVTRGAVRDVALPVLRHRVIPSFRAEAEGLTADDLICRLLLETPAFQDKASYDEATRRILRL